MANHGLYDIFLCLIVTTLGIKNFSSVQTLYGYITTIYSYMSLINVARFMESNKKGHYFYLIYNV